MSDSPTRPGSPSVEAMALTLELLASLSPTAAAALARVVYLGKR